MHLPWLSRARYERDLAAARAEYERELSYAHDQLEAAHRHIENLVRVGGRTPRDRPAPTRASIPREVEDEIKRYDSHRTRQQLRHEARQAHAQGETWDSICAALRHDPVPVGAGSGP